MLDADPDLDFYDGRLAREALAGAECVVAVSGYKRAAEYADVLLPMALYAENSGSYLNMEGRMQRFDAVAPPPGSARPAWKIICSLAGALGLSGFRYDGFEQACAETAGMMGEAGPDHTAAWSEPETLAASGGSEGLQRIGYVPMNSVDALVRHAPALQQTEDVADGSVHLNRRTARKLDLDEQEHVMVAGASAGMRLPLKIDDTVADDSALIHGGHVAGGGLGPLSGPVTISRV